MKTLNTILGTVTITDVRMVLSSGYGQYRIIIDFDFEGQNKVIGLNSTDSQLFDLVNGKDNSADLLLQNASYVIECAINDYINSL